MQLQLLIPIPNWHKADYGIKTGGGIYGDACDTDVIREIGGPGVW